MTELIDIDIFYTPFNAHTDKVITDTIKQFKGVVVGSGCAITSQQREINFEVPVEQFKDMTESQIENKVFEAVKHISDSIIVMCTAEGEIVNRY